MNTGTTVVAITGAGLLGGFVGALLVHELDGPRFPSSGETIAANIAVRDLALENEVASLRARLDEMQVSVGARAEEATKLREETALVRKELEQERKAGAESRDRLAAVEAGGGRNAGGRILHSTGAVPLGEGQFAFSSSGDPAFAERMKKIAELRQKSEEERWTAARDALGLSSSQEEELKTAMKERNEAMRAALKFEAKDAPGADGSPQIQVAIPDAQKMVDARRKYDDRVNASLSADQAKKWKDDGYEGSLGGGMRSMAVAIQADAVIEPPK